MAYDFTTVLDRSGRDLMAVNKMPVNGIEIEEGFSRIPMWVADMSFPTAPSIIEAIKERLKMPNFGYITHEKPAKEAIKKWHRIQRGENDITDEMIGFENGVLGGVATAVSAFTTPGDRILLHTPFYLGFEHTVSGMGRKLVFSRLNRDKEGIWRMDFDEMDVLLKQHKIHMAILCAPHNPCGRVWERWEMEKAMQVFKENDCLVISDEIWADLVMPGHCHVSPQLISEDAKERTIALSAPSKTFSIAGLIGSYSIVYNKYLRDRMNKQSCICQYNKPNVLSLYALLGAYSEEGAVWLSEVVEVLNDNLTYAHDFIHENFPGCTCMKPEGTYMLYIDCSDYCKKAKIGIGELIAAGIKKGVVWQDGADFGLQNTIRLNVALPKSVLIEAMDRLKKHVFI